MLLALFDGLNANPCCFFALLDSLSENRYSKITFSSACAYYVHIAIYVCARSESAMGAQSTTTEKPHVLIIIVFSAAYFLETNNTTKE